MNEETKPVEPVVALEVPVTEPVVATEVPIVGEVIAPVPVDATPAELVVVVYNGQQVVKHLGQFQTDGAELCELADGSTTYVPKSILGA